MATDAASPAVRDLGTVSGPLLVFGGPHGNLQATEALLAEARRLGIPPANMVCTGDVVAYCADPRATVASVRAAGVHVVMGNCEESLAGGSDDCGCGFRPGSACDLLSAAWFAHARAELDDAARAWMGGLPRRLLLDLGGRRLAVVHGTAEEIARFVFASTPATEKTAAMDRLGVDGIVAGHCGLPFTDLAGGRLWHNAGAIGMPANDGTPRVWYSLLTADHGGIRVERRALAYDHRAAAARMAERGLPEAYARTLIDGLWPTMDVLPAAERDRRGVAIEAVAEHWPGAPRHAGAALAR